MVTWNASPHDWGSAMDEPEYDQATLALLREQAKIRAEHPERPRMSNGRLWDDECFSPPGTPRSAPQTVSGLINRLTLYRATQAEQEAGIREWLASNESTDYFRRDLKRKGLTHLLPDSRS